MSGERPIAITIGDPAGIGPEIVAKLAAASLPAPVVAIGDVGAIRRAAAQVAPSLRIAEISRVAEAGAASGRLAVLPASRLPDGIRPGRVDARCGQAAYDAIVMAARAALAGEVRAVVTAPIHKEALAAAGIRFPGHTELLADLAGVEHVAMMLANTELRVLLVSIHISLADAIRAVTRSNVARAIGFADAAARSLGFARPRVAVAGLNPHAGEGGLMGHEEAREITPAIADARAEGIDASGPYPPDTVFMRARRGEFDMVVAQYHDQGLIPVKYLGIDQGVNVTIGLPFVRTSVDHGTAFEIAGRGIADPSSLRAAFDLAVSMTREAPGAEA